MNKFDEIQQTCPLCGNRFNEADSKAGCRGCPLAHGCHMVRCPNCGYEVPVAPKLNLKTWWRHGDGTKRKS